MPLNHEWLTRIKAVEREHRAIRQATDRFKKAARHDPSALKGDLRYRDLDHASDNLDGTYIIRLFAEFETGLRQYWDRARGTHPPTRDLLEGLVAMRGIPDEQREQAHAVREYRNSLVHEREEESVVMPVDAARGHLCRFLSFLPPQW